MTARQQRCAGPDQPGWGHEVAPTESASEHRHDAPADRTGRRRDHGPGHDRGHGRGHRHGHGPGHAHTGGGIRELLVALGLIVAFLIGELVVAVLAHSVALFADAGHMLTDVGALAAAAVAARLATRPPRGLWTFGFQRAEILSAAVNGLTLLVVAVVIAVEAGRRLVDPPPVHGTAVAVVALVGALVNVAATLVLSRADRSSLNVQGAFQHVLTDLYAFVATGISGVLVATLGWRRADPVASYVVVALMLLSAWRLLRAAGLVLLQVAPEDVDLADVRRHMLELRHVQGVHDLHVWTMTSGLPVLSAHVVVDDVCLADGRAAQLLDRLQECLVGHFDVEHSTLQLEPASHGAHEPGQHD